MNKFLLEITSKGIGVVMSIAVIVLNIIGALTTTTVMGLVGIGLIALVLDQHNFDGLFLRDYGQIRRSNLSISGWSSTSSWLLLRRQHSANSRTDTDQITKGGSQ